MTLAINGRFYAAPVTGVQRYAIEITRHLAAQSDVVLLLPANARRELLPAKVRTVQGRLNGHAWEQLELRSMARRQGAPTVLHLAGTAPFRCDNDVVVIHDVLPLTHPQWFSRSFSLWRRVVLRAAGAHAAHITTSSKWARDEIVRELSVPADRITLTTQGLDPFSSPASAELVAAVRARLGLPDEFLLAVGAGDTRKNIAFMSGVLEEWRRRKGRPLELIAVGAPQRQWLASDSQSSNEFRTLGHVDDVTLHALYSAASTLCFPSLAEGLGRPPLEAIACGTPSVVADYGAVTEIADAVTRVVPLEVTAWADALEQTTLSRPSEATRQAVRARYNWDTAAEQVLAVCMACA
jgi:glycosyltransferase involved in cell wall biosynthesis